MSGESGGDGVCEITTSASVIVGAGNMPCFFLSLTVTGGTDASAGELTTRLVI